MSELERARVSRTFAGIFAGLAFAAVLTIETHAGHFFYSYLLIVAGAFLWLMLLVAIRRRPGEPPIEDYPYGATAPRRPSPGSPPEHQT